MTPAEFDAWLIEPRRRPLVMGILNVTPDSFSDGGQFSDVSRAADHAAAMIADGADLIDIGGESTRPGALPVAADEQIRRIVPVIQAVSRLSTTVSVDTTQSPVAAAALDAGAHIINDISSGRDDPAIFTLAARRNAPLILMHMQGTPATMQHAPAYGDVVAEVTEFLKSRIAAAVSAGVKHERLLIDPGIGFGKTVAHNLELLRRLAEIANKTARPLVLGTSRKGFIGKITGETDVANRVFGTAATTAWGIANGAAIVRVHDVKATSQVTRMIRAIQLGEGDVAPR